jgi:hypothetical protein
MPRFSIAFNIEKTQAELDFVDVSLTTDNLLFLDPFALSQRLDRWSQDAHRTVVTFFQNVIDDIRSGNEDRARGLLLHLREPNETRLGYSARRPQGAGIGNMQAEELFEALRDSAAVRTGFISSLEESELMIDGISHDKISDLTTNILRGHLAEYTAQQCSLHGLPIHQVAMPPCFNTDLMEWQSRYLDLPVYRGSPVLLVPKSIVRRSPAYQHQQYYQHFVLNFLQQEELNSPGSRLVKTLKNRRRVVYKTDLAAVYPRTKTFLYEFSREHPEVLRGFRQWLEADEANRMTGEVDEEDEVVIANAIAEALRHIPPGSENASGYHKLMIGIVEFLFFPHLLHPRKEHEIHQGRKRIDILVENGARAGIFNRIPNTRGYPCAYVAFECKNYITEVANPELDQLAGRFSVNRGKLGFLSCRHFEDRALFVERCRDTFCDDRGLIIPLDDAVILHMLGLIENRRRGDIDEVLSGLVAEIWAR